MYLNQNVYLNNQDGTFTRGLFKGYSVNNNEVCYFKPVDKRNITGYGMTITCLKKLVLENLNEVEL